MNTEQESWGELIDKLYPHLKALKHLPYTIKIGQAKQGWFVAAYRGDGSKPGSLEYAAGGFDSPEEAFDWLPDKVKDLKTQIIAGTQDKEAIDDANNQEWTH